MIIPNMTIVYAGILKMKCSAQVVYRHEDEEKKMVHCGLAITDMDVKSYSYLNHILGTYIDNHARVSTEVNMDALWEFFFDTGFIYGEKYEHLQSYRETFKETYRKLYQDNADIARHFIYERNGKIYGHMSMVHAYNHSWVIHHFAAKPMESKMPGMMILKQITHYINDFYRLSSSGMDYEMAYYQPENKIMDRIFGGFVKYLENPQGSSLDIFSYIHFERGSYDQSLPLNWILRQYIPSDFEELNNFYLNHSGGLLLNSLELNSSIQSLKEAYSKAGFKRDRRIFCLCFKDKPRAFMIVNQSDLGLNLSDLLNSIKIIIVDERLKWNIILSAVNKLCSYYEEYNIPLLIYPNDYLTKQGIKNSKNYALWILKNDPYSAKYYEYVGNNFRMKYRTN
jgi:hypothetical protein